MIIEGFEIENWGCIRQRKVERLPETGVIVLHGPNGTGKSSIVAAIRACLMDYQSKTSAADLTRWYPKFGDERPRVAVTFRSGGSTYRITKQFGSNKSKLESRTTGGDWQVLTATPAEAHDRTCALAGGPDSTKGLHQLLWLTQAEFRLPEAKKFDVDVQSRLRGILGVLQTPLDDRFIERVKLRWNRWFSGQRKPGRKQTEKPSSELTADLHRLEATQVELRSREAEFEDAERMLLRLESLELTRKDLERQRTERSAARDERRVELQRAQSRLAARLRAEEQAAAAQADRAAAEAALQNWIETDKRRQSDERAVETAGMKADQCSRNVQSVVGQKNALNQCRSDLRETLRDVQQRIGQITERRLSALLKTQADEAQRLCDSATEISKQIDQRTKFLAEHTAPDDKSLGELKVQREAALQLRANLAAAAMRLALHPEPGAAAPQLSIDGAPHGETLIENPPEHFLVRRRAEVRIPGWGLVAIDRGTDSETVDDLENTLRTCERQLADALAGYGIEASNSQAFDLLLERVADHKSHAVELKRLKADLKTVAPQGLEPLQRNAAELRSKWEVSRSRETAAPSPLPDNLDSLQRDADEFAGKFTALDGEITSAEQALIAAQGDETAAKVSLAAAKATLQSRREELERLPSRQLLDDRVTQAAAAVTAAETALARTELSTDEQTVQERLQAEEEAVRILERQITENRYAYHELKGKLSDKEGLHAERARLSARAEQLRQNTDREILDRDAFDRLYALFEECRDKQLGTVMKPIHDRVLHWMHLLGLAQYGEVRFNDAFLPESLAARVAGTEAEFALGDESTGTQEQIGMLVRLALGSTLATFEEPCVAILDDPLTHSDVVRLNRMRIVLKSAAEGNRDLSPPAGPLQIIIFTCHPEWFATETAHSIDLTIDGAPTSTRIP